MRQSGLMKKHSQEIDTYANTYKDIIQQFDIDTLCIAMNRFEGWGYNRLMRLLKEWELVRKELYPAIDIKDPECDVAQERMEKRFSDICKDHAKPIPFAKRYPCLKGVSYEGRKK